MTLATYANLKSALANLLNRDDLAAEIPDFIALFEADFDANPATARHRRRICRAQAEISGEYETLPSNFLAVQSIALATEPSRWLEYIDPDSLERMVQNRAAWAQIGATETGQEPAAPKFYSIVGTEIRFFPAPQTSYDCNLTVYERLARLAADGDSNWLLTYFPGLYLYGSALHSAPFLGADERAPLWQGLYEDGWAKLAASDPPPTSKTTLRTEAAALTAAGRSMP
jgi:hypothetical protein